MIRELSIQESYDWLRSTLQQLSSIPHLSEDDFAYTVFEVLDVDVRSAMSEVALDRLVSGSAISDSARSEILRLRSEFLALLESAYAVESASVAQIQGDVRWLDIACGSERILSEYIHEEAA